MKRKFILEKKMVASVRYYEYMFVIRDRTNERIYTGNDEKTAKTMLRLLNGYHARLDRKREMTAKRKKRK